MKTQHQDVVILQERQVGLSVRFRACPSCAADAFSGRRAVCIGRVVLGPQDFDGDAGYEVQNVAHERLDIGRQHGLQPKRSRGRAGVMGGVILVIAEPAAFRGVQIGRAHKRWWFLPPRILRCPQAKTNILPTETGEFVDLAIMRGWTC